MKPIVVVAGIMDTKGKELLYIRDRVRVMGCDTLMIELSLGKEVKADWIDVHISDLLRGVDKTPSDIFAMTRGDAAKVVTEAAIKYITRLQKSGKMHALIAYCGGMGSSIVAPVMQTLPYGMPKILLSTMVHCAEQYLANKDIAMLYSVTEAGLNHISRQILNTAAGVVAGGAKAYVDFKDEDAKPLIAVTMQGVTTPCAERVMSHIAQSNEYDGMIIHANGEGGRTLEYMAKEGCFRAMAEITLGEMSANLLHGINDAGPDRLNSAIACGIPQVLAPGSVDFSSFRNRDAMAPRLLEEEKAGVLGRRTHYHNTNCTVCTITPDEAYGQGKTIADKLNKAKDTVCILVPMRGWSAYDISAPDIKRGWAGPGSGPSWVPNPEHPEWSLRAEYFINGFMSAIDKSNKHVEMYRVDMHINQPEFADLFYLALHSILDGRYEKGSLANGKIVEKLF